MRATAAAAARPPAQRRSSAPLTPWAPSIPSRACSPSLRARRRRQQHARSLTCTRGLRAAPRPARPLPHRRPGPPQPPGRPSSRVHWEPQSQGLQTPKSACWLRPPAGGCASEGRGRRSTGHRAGAARDGHGPGCAGGARRGQRWGACQRSRGPACDRGTRCGGAHPGHAWSARCRCRCPGHAEGAHTGGGCGRRCRAAAGARRTQAPQGTGRAGREMTRCPCRHSWLPWVSSS